MVVYGRQPITAVDLAPIPCPGQPPTPALDMANQLRHIHEQVHQKLQESVVTYKQQADRHRRRVIFQPGDYVWAFLPPERQPAGSYHKINDRKFGTLEVLARINHNAYKLKLCTSSFSNS
ncbi:hypothetical protein Drorol1_Dr00014130 [Drosera rotundifolia]